MRTPTPGQARHPGSLLADPDWTKQRFCELISLAAELKRDKRAGTERARLTGRTVALLFEKNSTRTRCAFEVAAYDQGGHVTYLGSTGSHVGKEESIADTARVLGGMYDAIAFRGYDQSVVEQLADHAGVPVWNALTDQWHPTQSLADVLTMTEHHPGPVEEISFCFCGDGRNNVARSLLVSGALLGMDVRIAAPPSLQPPAEVVAAAQVAADASGGRLMVTDDLAAGVRGAHFVHTDVWLSMGEPDEQWASRIRRAEPVPGDRCGDGVDRPGRHQVHALPAVDPRPGHRGRRAALPAVRDRRGRGQRRGVRVAGLGRLRPVGEQDALAQGAARRGTGLSLL